MTATAPTTPKIRLTGAPPPPPPSPPPLFAPASMIAGPTSPETGRGVSGLVVSVLEAGSARVGCWSAAGESEALLLRTVLVLWAASGRLVCRRDAVGCGSALVAAVLVPSTVASGNGLTMRAVVLVAHRERVVAAIEVEPRPRVEIVVIAGAVVVDCTGLVAATDLVAAAVAGGVVGAGVTGDVGAATEKLLETLRMQIMRPSRSSAMLSPPTEWLLNQTPGKSAVSAFHIQPGGSPVLHSPSISWAVPQRLRTSAASAHASRELMGRNDTSSQAAPRTVLTRNVSARDVPLSTATTAAADMVIALDVTGMAARKTNNRQTDNKFTSL